MKTKIIVAGLITVLLSSGMAGVASAEQSIKLFGYITEDADAPVKSNCCISVNYRDQSGAFFKNTNTSENGYYELTVPYHTSYDFFVEGRNCGDPYFFSYIPVKKTVSVAQAADVRVDFKLKLAANLVIQAYDSSGTLIRNKDFMGVTNGEAYATDPDNLPHYAVYYPINDSYSISKGPKSNVDLAVPAFIVLPQTLYKIHFLWEVPEFGKVMLSADNEGKGYSVESKGGQLILNLNYEAAKSKVAMLKRDYDSLRNEGYDISSLVAEGLKQSQEHLKKVEAMLQSPSPDMRTAVQELDLSLKHSLFAHEQLYLDKAKADIEKYRKGDINIKVEDKEGKPLSDCTLSFKQTSHDFIFSATPHSSSYSQLLKDAGINSVTAYCSKYGEIEPEPGRFDWRFTDNQVDAQLRDGFTSIGNLGWLFFRGWGLDNILYS